MEIDYKSLLRRYLRHVGECEGTVFLRHNYDWSAHKYFSPEEIEELKRLDKEGEDEFRYKDLKLED